MKSCKKSVSYIFSLTGLGIAKMMAQKSELYMFLVYFQWSILFRYF
jgi:hypothetical protein